MDRNALAELLQALESRRDAEERRREERYTALIERLLREAMPSIDKDNDSYRNPTRNSSQLHLASRGRCDVMGRT
ncbi:UNVERIFIED_CONTAM: hypothetical protein FKN15_024298 [Acipenser sinensis]